MAGIKFYGTLEKMNSIITMSGFPGSGKSTIADKVAEELDYSRFSSGDFMRELAAERGLTLAELSAQAEENPAIDKKIDAKNKEFQAAEQVVIDSRLGFHFIPKSFAVYLDVSNEEAARRINTDNKDSREKAGENHSSIEETAEAMLERVSSERERYQKLYNLDHTDTSNYDLVIDTTDKTISEVTKAVLSGYKNWQTS